jgi:hypothetical protein
MKRHLLVRCLTGRRSTLAILLLLTTTLQVCAAADSATRYQHVTLTNNNMFVVDGASVPLAKLTARLKSVGATPETAILVAVPDGTPQSTLNAVAGKLKSDGFGRMVFTKPRHATATVADQPGPQPTTTATKSAAPVRRPVVKTR